MAPVIPVVTKITLAASKLDNGGSRHYCFVVEGNNFTSDNRDPVIKINNSNLFNAGVDLKKRRLEATGKVWLVKAKFKQVAEGDKAEERKDIYGSEEISVTVTNPDGGVSNGGPSAILYEYGDPPPG